MVQEVGALKEESGVVREIGLMIRIGAVKEISVGNGIRVVNEIQRSEGAGARCGEHVRHARQQASTRSSVVTELGRAAVARPQAWFESGEWRRSRDAGYRWRGRSVSGVS